MAHNTDILPTLCITTRHRAGQNLTKMENEMMATVKYQIATYSGEVQVNCNENDEDEYIIAKAKK